jgi:hypothetical protein
MSVLGQDIIKDLELARKFLSETDNSVVVIKYNKIWKHKKGDGIRPLIEVIDEMGQDIYESVIGDRILGKASALLCRYAKAAGVYSPQGTKTAIALLIMGAVPCQVDEMIPQIMNRYKNGPCPFEEMLKDVDSPDKAYKILKEKLPKK